jgi:hypothetical protein
MTKSTLAAKYKSLMVRKSHKKAIVAVAHKMIRLIYILLSRATALSRPGHRLRGHERQEERPALDQATQGHRQVACTPRIGGRCRHLIRR